MAGHTIVLASCCWLPLHLLQMQSSFAFRAGFSAFGGPLPEAHTIDNKTQVRPIDRPFPRAYNIGERVQVRDANGWPWMDGVVMSTGPLKVGLNGWKNSFTWVQVRPEGSADAPSNHTGKVPKDWIGHGSSFLRRDVMSSCHDDPSFRDVRGYKCKHWSGWVTSGCWTNSFRYKKDDVNLVRMRCPQTCGTCHTLELEHCKSTCKGVGRGKALVLPRTALGWVTDGIASIAYDHGSEDYSKPLPSHGPLGNRTNALRVMGALASAIYKGDKEKVVKGWTLFYFKAEDSSTDTAAQAGAYESPDYPDVVIVAIRGTNSMFNVVQDVSIAWSGPSITAGCKSARNFLEKVMQMRPHAKFYVTGHSLGGYLAESAASWTDVDGAVFNSPGPWSSKTHFSNAGPKRPKFEIHLSNDDPVGLLFPRPQQSAHIGTPTWHPGHCHCEAGGYFAGCKAC